MRILVYSYNENPPYDFFKIPKNTRGGISLALGSLIFVSAVILGFLMATQVRIEASKRQLEQSQLSLVMSSAVEAALMSMHLAEMRYIEQGQACSTSLRSFLEALKKGHGCPGLGDVSVFTTQDAKAREIKVNPLFSYSQQQGCKITETVGLKCAGQNPPVELLNIGYTSDVQKIGNLQFKVTLLNIDVGRQLSEFNLEVKSSDYLQNKTFALKTSLNNTAHLEQDGRVTQSHPNPLDQCLGTPWSIIKVFDPVQQDCLAFAQAGGGWGLAFHMGRFFGMRPYDGTVIDMLSLTDMGNSSYFINEDGTLAGHPHPVFPAFSKEALVNTSDITTLEDQVYYVALGGQDAHLGALGAASDFVPDPLTEPTSSPAYYRIPLCPLGLMGWSQSYSGIAAAGWSNKLLPDINENYSRLAVMYLKTKTGALLTAFVNVTKGQVMAPNCTHFKAHGANFSSCCFVIKDNELQEAEYQRTRGFDRADLVKPYYFY